MVLMGRYRALYEGFVEKLGQEVQALLQKNGVKVRAVVPS
jgi:hypothetical protein